MFYNPQSVICALIQRYIVQASRAKLEDDEGNKRYHYHLISGLLLLSRVNSILCVIVFLSQMPLKTGYEDW